jgi:hypothetical protein
MAMWTDSHLLCYAILGRRIFYAYQNCNPNQTFLSPSMCEPLGWLAEWPPFSGPLDAWTPTILDSADKIQHFRVETWSLRFRKPALSTPRLIRLRLSRPRQHAYRARNADQLPDGANEISLTLEVLDQTEDAQITYGAAAVVCGERSRTLSQCRNS